MTTTTSTRTTRSNPARPTDTDTGPAVRATTAGRARLRSIHVPMPADLYRALDDLAWARRTTKAGLVRRLISEAIAGARREAEAARGGAPRTSRRP